MFERATHDKNVLNRMGQLLGVKENSHTFYSFIENYRMEAKNKLQSRPARQSEVAQPQVDVRCVGTLYVRFQIQIIKSLRNVLRNLGR